MEKLSNLSRQEKKNFRRINNEIEEVAVALKLPENITEKVFQLYLKAKRKNLLRGRKWKTTFAACLYVVIRKEEIPQTIKEITNKLNISFRGIEYLSSSLAQKLQIKFPPVNIFSFIDRFCFELNLSDKIEEKAKEILKKATEAKLTNGRGPIGTAAAVIYIAALLNHEDRTQKEVSDITGVTIVTIRNRHREIAKELDIDALL